MSNSLPTIHFFDADDNSICDGDDVTLSWRVTGATLIGIQPGLDSDVLPHTGSETVSPTETTTYFLKAWNDSGFSYATVEVGVGEPEIAAFHPVRRRVCPNLAGGEATELTWVVNNATCLRIDQGVGDVTSETEVTVSPVEDTTYTLTATNACGSSTATATVSAGKPVVHSFTAEPSEICSGSGGSVTLSWDVTGADTISINGIGQVTDQTSVEVTPSEDTTYRLFARNDCGAVYEDVTVTMRGVPVITSFTANPPVLGEPDPTITGVTESSILVWEVEGLDPPGMSFEAGLILDPGGIDVSVLTQYLVSPDETTTYTLTPRNACGEGDQADVTVWVNVTSP